jgi:phosphatidylglycerol:prolipoprotein diacylglycerol transferase
MINYTPVRALFSVGNFTVHSWGLMFVIAFLVGFFLVLREAKRKEINEKHVYNISLLILVGTIIGARLFHIFENLGFYFSHPAQILALTEGGMTSYGGIFLAILFTWLYIRKQKELTFAKILDLYAPYVALALAIGRIGCFLNWCCYGQASSMPWAIKVSGDFARHPTQIYESIAYLITFFILMKLKRVKEEVHSRAETRGKKFRGFEMNYGKGIAEQKGFIFLSFLILYSVFRFLIDFMREYAHYWRGLAESQWICIIIVVISLVIILRKK